MQHEYAHRKRIIKQGVTVLLVVEENKRLRKAYTLELISTPCAIACIIRALPETVYEIKQGLL